MPSVVHILLVLPDGKIVLQRRDGNTKVSPHKLALFGGSAEPGEPPDQAIRRELSEETSLDVTGLEIQPIHEFELTSQDGSRTHFYSYKTIIPNADFEVREGSGAEIYKADELLARDDVVPSVRHALMKLGD